MRFRILEGMPNFSAFFELCCSLNFATGNTWSGVNDKGSGCPLPIERPLNRPPF